MVLAVLMLLVGGGFLPIFVGLIAGVAGIGIHAPFAGWRAHLGETTPLLAVLTGFAHDILTTGGTSR